MTVIEWTALLPLVILAMTPAAAMVALAVCRSYRMTCTIAAAGLLLAFLALFRSFAPAPLQVTPLLMIDRYALFFIGLMVSAGFVVVLLSYEYMKVREERREEFYILVLTALLGSAILACACHLASLFLGLEILSVSLYALIAYHHGIRSSIEAGIKYLVLASFSSAFLVFGTALVYAESGTLEITRMALTVVAPGTGPVLQAGTILIVIGIAFKLAVVPFHMWAPDIYEGSPAPVTAFIATVSKGAVFAFLLRSFSQVDFIREGAIAVFFTLMAVASMFAGNLLALFQDNVKRLLAYSSVAHMGYLLVAFLADGPIRVAAVAFYLVAYFVTTLGAFGVVTVLSGESRDADALDDYRGLFYRRPWLAGIFTAMLLSLAGIPMTAGFIGKFYLMTAGVGNALWMLVMSLVITSAIGLYYYLRVVVVLYEPQAETPTVSAALPAATAALTAMVLLLLWLGIYPGPVVEMIQAMGTIGY
ncbi:MAG TPA: NADH-quinone oxidoreductase subunit N [Syntrophales bacterium]|nr:NADH-quinone oxidoreductase subunit N [Syntrophales bacterium]HRT60808.1 NADH-quinone oxidoreductase subunit N [Syntrophales bacterium]